jgi:DNA polymerase-1
MKPIILVDGSSYLYRAFHALPPLTNSKGQPTGAIFGVINMLKKLLADYQPDDIAVIFDSKGKTFRDHLYADYKANRAAMPDDLRTQVEPLYALIRAMGIPILIIEDVEADDVIGTLACQAAKQQQPVIISTSDKDMAQLVNGHVTLINTMSNSLLDEKGVIDKFGVKPNQIIDYLTLIGDTSDNVPGVPGVGPKTAAKWLNHYLSLENLIINCSNISGKIADAFQACIAQFPLMKELVTIKCDVDLPLTINDIKRQEPDQKELIALVKELEFRSWLSELLGSPPPERKKHTTNLYQAILTEYQFNELLNKLSGAHLFAVDTETTSLNIIDAQIVGLSFAFADGDACYLPLAHDYMDAPVQLNREKILKQLKPFLEDPHPRKIGHHIKYDKNVLRNHGIELEGIAFDTMLESYVLDSTATRHDMDSLALKYLGKRTILFEEVAGKGAKQLTFNQVAVEEATKYAAEDADITWQLHEKLWPKLQQHAGSIKTLQEIELPVALVLTDMERHGVLIDAELLKAQSKTLTLRIAELELQAFKEVGNPFNLCSPKQLQEILYGKMGLPILVKTPSGQPSTAENVLQDLAHDYLLPRIILEHRSLSKLKSTYTDKLPEEVNTKTNRVHTSYQQAIASTGRLSSSNPNLQNIPIKTEEGRRIRQAFIAPPGYQILSADYSQIELRLMAHLSHDESLLHAFSNGLDIHSATAAEIFNVPVVSVTSEQRRRAKTINFGLIYGMSSFGLAKQLGVERAEAQHYIDTYFARYPGVKNYMENTRKLAHQQGFVTTIFGRQLHLPEINARNMMRQKAAERAAINAPLQGSAADLIKLAMIQIHHWLKQEKLPAQMIMQVHDELVFEVTNSYIDQLKIKIKEIMENVMPIEVPLLVSIGVGPNWDAAH